MRCGWGVIRWRSVLQKYLFGTLMDWSRVEVEAIVADYLQMLTLELAGQTYSKTKHRLELLQKLRDRSEPSIEFKHCNISAAMIDLGFPYIRGYKPRSNYQALLVTVAAEQVRGKTTLITLLLLRFSSLQ